MKYKCYKCNQLKEKDGFDDKWFKIVKKVCLKCEMKLMERLTQGERDKKEIEMKREKVALQNKLEKYQKGSTDKIKHSITPDEWKSDKWGHVWMNKDDKFTAYRKGKHSYIPLRTFRSRFTGLPTIKVKWNNGNEKYYPVEKMYNWIWN